jgi:hypothetical protein
MAMVIGYEIESQCRKASVLQLERRQWRKANESNGVMQL